MRDTGKRSLYVSILGPFYAPSVGNMKRDYCVTFKVKYTYFTWTLLHTRHFSTETVKHEPPGRERRHKGKE